MFNIFKKIFHDMLGWHQPDASNQTFNGCSIGSVCKYCGKEILLDSQGNWFAVDEI